MSARCPIGLIIRRSVHWNLFKRSKSSCGFACLCNCNRSPNKGTNAGCDSHQSLVEQSDFLPINASALHSISVNGLNGRFQLIASHSLRPGGQTQLHLSFFNYWLRPKRCLLLVQGHKLTIACETCFTSRFTMQHQCE